tara:strand:+ start:1140 stop:1358 length:219 start_codon:yes stop_codon:yes gene_type:complete
LFRVVGTLSFVLKLLASAFFIFIFSVIRGEDVFPYDSLANVMTELFKTLTYFLFLELRAGVWINSGKRDGIN